MLARAPLPALLLLASLLVGACVGPVGRERAASESEQSAYDGALARLSDDPEAAGSGFESILREFPESPLADDAAEQLALLALQDGRREQAFGWLYHVIREYPHSDRADPVRLRLARWEYERGRLEDARRLLQRLRVVRLGEAERRAYYRLWVDLSEDPIERLPHLAQLRWFARKDVEMTASAADSVPALRARHTLARIEDEIDSALRALSVEQLERAAAQVRGRAPAARVRLEWAQRLLAQPGDSELVTELLEDARRQELSPRDRDRLARLELQLAVREGGAVGPGEQLPSIAELAARPRPQLEGAVGTIGVVLPLSGPYAAFGEEALRGALLAAGLFEVPEESSNPEPAEEPAPEAERFDAGAPGSGALAPGPARPVEEGLTLPEFDGRIRLVVRDSGGSAQAAAAAVHELARDPALVAVIGPLLSGESDAAAQAAEQEGLPLLTLSNRSEVAATRDWIFRLRTTPDDELRLLVGEAVQRWGASRFAVLYPKSRFGRGMRKRYWDAVLAHAGKMVAAASYAPDSTDFSAPIRSMIGYPLLTQAEQTALQERERLVRAARRLEPEEAAIVREIAYSVLGPEAKPLPPIVDFDVLFIPDGHEKIELIAPQLAFHEIKGVHLLGSSDWNDPDLVRIARKHVNGALIVASFFAESPFDFVRKFVHDYRQSFESEPDDLSAHAYDAINLVRAQLASGHDSRPQIRNGILHVRDYLGVSGVTAILPDGNARKRPFLLGVKRGRIVGLD